MNLLDQLAGVAKAPYVKKDRSGRVVKEGTHTFVEGSNPHMLYRLLIAHDPGKSWNTGEIAEQLQWTEGEAKSSVRQLRVHGYVEDVGSSGRYKLYRLTDKRA